MHLSPVDGFRALEFTMALSSFYQGLPPKNITPFIRGTPYPLPHDDPTMLSPPNPDLDPRTADSTCTVGEAVDFSKENVKNTQFLSIRMSPAQASKLKEQCIEALTLSGELSVTGTGDVHLSTQDAVIALVISVVNRFASVPINHVYSLWNVSARDGARRIPLF